jgi:hypothetical protein
MEYSDFISMDLLISYPISSFSKFILQLLSDIYKLYTKISKKTTDNNKKVQYFEKRLKLCTFD